MKVKIRWQFNQEQLDLIKAKHSTHQLYYAIQLKYYEKHQAFCPNVSNLSHKIILKVTKLLDIKFKSDKTVSSRTNSNYRKEIRQYFKYQRTNAKHESLVKDWLTNTILPQKSLNLDQLKRKVLTFLKDKKIEPFGNFSLERIIKSARHQYEGRLFAAINKDLDCESQAYLDGLLLTRDKLSYFAWIKRWPNTSLLDVLKETDLFVKFIQEFIPSGSKEALSEEEIKKRLLLTILGYGTNTGLKSMVAGNDTITYEDLQYIKLRYLDPDNLKKAIQMVINQLLKVRSPEIWYHCTTAVASDSKLFRAADQNLMSRWHPRYHKKGVMIYWHVDTKAICIYSQLESCSSSEVAAIIEGVLRRCSDMNVQKNYVDTHGASEVGFAFSHILNFELLPRFKDIHTQRLYTVEDSDSKKYNRITSIISNSIKWHLIENQCDQIIKYSAAMKLGTADSATIMKRFTRENSQNPVYKALCELGKVIKTIFLCHYLSSQDLRREINEGLNVVERWNGINDFIFYGKSAVMRSNNPAELRLSMLCLHLLQLSMVYINTLMLQQVIKESHWLSKMTMEDKRAITHEHINPYGLFLLDLNQRLAINHPFIKLAA